MPPGYSSHLEEILDGSQAHFQNVAVRGFLYKTKMFSDLLVGKRLPARFVPSTNANRRLTKG